MQLPVERRLDATVDLQWPSWRKFSLAEKGLAACLALSVILAGGVLAYVAITPRPGDNFTEFHILGTSGTAEGYPTSLDVAEKGTVLITVTNHEFTLVDYAIRVDLVGLDIVWNETGGFEEAMEMNRTNLAWFNVTLNHETNWSQWYNFSINAPGEWLVQLLLFRDGNLDASYRNLHLFVTVGAG